MAKIFLVGNNETDFKFLNIILQKLGHQTVFQNTTDGAVEKVDELMPDITIIEPEIDDYNGFELCKNIRQNRKFRHIPVILVCDTSDGDMTVTGFECGATDYLSKPINEDEVKIRIDTRLEIIKTHLKAQAKNEQFTREMEKIVKQTEHPQMQTILAIANLAQSRDDNTGKHLDRMQKYTYVLVNEMKNFEKYKNIITDKFISEVTAAAPLHDIGKIGIPDKILLKPGKLTEAEYEVIKTHTLIGDETLDNLLKTYGDSSFIDTGKKIARSHHERPDGQGYPDGLKDGEIPLEASIMAIADVYDALRTKKTYKPAISHEKAIEIINNGKGTQFLNEAVEAFNNVEKTFSYIWLEYETMCV
ncbi:MAG: HD domain-containing protein [Candidatus Gastranaerophilales bacterium]|nr:HD domain-containing protein [Candidatus Gastranaerophilales bacterium]